MVIGSCVPSCVPLVASVTRRDAERGSKRPSAERVVIELVGDWSFEICHSAAVANSSLFTIHFSLPMAVAARAPLAFIKRSD